MRGKSDIFHSQKYCFFKKKQYFCDRNKTLHAMSNRKNGIIRPDRHNMTEYRKVLEAVRDGALIRLRNGLYADPDAITGDIVDIEAIVPGGILCLYSAWYHYNLTTQVPDAFYVAVSRSRKLRLPQFPDIRPVFQRDELLEIGKTVTEERGVRLLITDIERSVCDAVKYRNKTGPDVMAEIIDNYLKTPGRNLQRLTEYAVRLRVYNTLRQILLIKL